MSIHYNVYLFLVPECFNMYGFIVFFMFCLDDRIILNCDCMIYSFIRAFAGNHADQYYAMARRNRNFQYQVLHKMQIQRSWVINTITLHNIRNLNHITDNILLLCGDVELNPGPTKKRNFWFNFSICHWNLNSLTSHNPFLIPQFKQKTII